MTIRTAKIIAISVVLLSSAMFFYFPMQKRGFDWFYFDSLALVIKSSVWHYGTLPLHNPWACSGLSMLSNPQNWLFSPLVLLTLIFPATLGNIISVVLLKLLGFWGAYKYLSQVKVSKEMSFLGAALFINSSWFALHFTEGHIAFRTFYLLPWVFLWMETLENRKILLRLGVLFSFMLLDGGIYPVIFSIVYFFFFYLTAPDRLKNLLLFLKKDIWFVLGTVLACVFLTLPKIYPVMLNFAAVRDIQEHQNISFSLLLKIFFDPFTNNTFVVENYYRFHEYGNYLGVATIALIALSIAEFKKIDKGLVQRIILLLIFLWIAMGWGGWFNPYQIISSLPYVKKAHVQSRYLIIFTFIFITLLCIIASRVRFKKTAFILMSLANFEALIANYYSFAPVGMNYELPLITRESWAETQKLLNAPTVYYREGIISKYCYEPSRMAPETKAFDEPGYVGEASSLSGDARVGPLRFTPGEITFNYESKNGAEILLNTNYLEGWIETSDEAKPFDHKSLLAVRVPAGNRTIRLQYSPPYYNFIIMSCLAGLIGLLFLRKKSYEL